ncbi:MAG: CHAT domain-containing protein [Pseudomonadota bacterium]
MRRFVALLVLSVAGGCGPEHNGQVAPPPWFSGCDDVIAGPTCLASVGSELSFWLPASRVDATVDAPDVSGMHIRREIVDGGTRLTIELAGKSRGVELRADGVQYRLEVTMLDDDPALKRARELEDDAAAIRALEALVDPYPGRARAAIARRYLAQDRLDDALAELGRARDAFRAAGRTLGAVKQSAASSYFLIHRYRDYPAASAELAAATSFGAPSSDGQYFLAYHRALLAFNIGDARGALGHLDRAATLARRLGWVQREAHVDQVLAIQLQMLGRRADARRLLERWVSHPSNAAANCGRAMLLNNLAWAILLQREAGEEAPDPMPYLLEAGELGQSQCRASEQTNIRINQALAELHSNDLAAARESLGRISKADLEAERRFGDWAQLILGDLFAREGQHAEAQRVYAELAELSQREGTFGTQWRALVGGARSLAKAGDPEAAARAYARAGKLVLEHLDSVPLAEGRESFLAMHAVVWREHVSLLLALGETRSAFDVMRLSRRQARSALAIDQHLPSMDAQQLAQWQAAIGRYQAERDEFSRLSRAVRYAPADQVATLEAARSEQRKSMARRLDDAMGLLDGAPVPARSLSQAADQLTVAFEELAEGWVVFVVRGPEVRTYRPMCRDLADNALAGCLVAPLDIELTDMRRLVVLSGPRDVSLDLASAAIGTRQLVDRVALSRVLDLPAVQGVQGDRAALVIADPTQTLPGARREADRVGEMLSESRWSVTSSEAGERALIAAQMSTASLLHFAGHAESAGVLGWDSALELGGGHDFRIGDVFALEHVPRFVVLSGCETGAASARSLDAAGIGLGEAFIARGSEWAVVTTRPVQDKSTRALITRFYSLWLQGRRPETALREAQLAARQRGDDWAAFRLLER